MEFKPFQEKKENPEEEINYQIPLNQPEEYKKEKIIKIDKKVFIPKNGKKIMKNIVFVGSTGNGKSSTANLIIGGNRFPVGKSMVSFTLEIQRCDVEYLNIRLIDTPGLNDNRMDEKNIDILLQGLTSNIIHYEKDSIFQIDAFILVAKCNPRASSLKPDLEKIRKLFGKIALKSLIILLIHPIEKGEDDISDEDVIMQFNEMVEVINILKDGKNEEEFSSNWITRWDNKYPRDNQLEELIKRINNKDIEPYTHKKFLEAQVEIQQQIDKEFKERFEEDVKLLDEKFAEDYKKKEKAIEEMKINFERQQEIELQNISKQYADDNQKKAKAFEEFKEKMQKEKELLAQEFEKRLNSTNVKREEELAKIKAAFDLKHQEETFARERSQYELTNKIETLKSLNEQQLKTLQEQNERNIAEERRKNAQLLVDLEKEKNNKAEIDKLHKERESCQNEMMKTIQNTLENLKQTQANKYYQIDPNYFYCKSCLQQNSLNRCYLTGYTQRCGHFIG